MLKAVRTYLQPVNWSSALQAAAPLLLVLLLLGGPHRLSAQRDIEPQLIFNDTARFTFTGEWQYLSTDIYLLNGERFSDVINELEFVRLEQSQRRRRRSGLAEERLEYLFITASLKHVKLLGDNSITYPLYNFQINRDADQKYHTYVSDNIDHIRIIDNLPLYTTSDHIDAELQVRAITNNDRDMVLGMVASQLKNLSALGTLSGAVLGIVGEFGSFIEANTKKKEYRFSSTIRLFEQKNFNTRVHSIKLYALGPNGSPPMELNTAPLSAFLDTVGHTLSRATLAELVGHTQYPVIAVVNYKSLYKLDPISGDEVTFANIEKRKLDIENGYRQSLINADTYRQEKDFIGFLTVYAHLKNHLDVYSLNYRTGNSDAISGSLFRVMQYYRQLIKTQHEMGYKYRNNGTYSSIFKPEYESIVGFASLHLDNDHNLKSTKELVHTLMAVERGEPASQLGLEGQVAALRFSGTFRPELMAQEQEGRLIQAHVERLEASLYRSAYEAEVLRLDSLPAVPSNQQAPALLLQRLNNTSCGLCRDRAIAAINGFGARLEQHHLAVTLAQHDSLRNALQPWLFHAMERAQRIGAGLGRLLDADSALQSVLYLQTKLEVAQRDMQNLRELLAVNPASKNLATMQALNTNMLGYQREVEEVLALICSLKAELCRCE
ncbi:MAG: hypothetical protein IJU72_03205 [Bacteroidales bacterium]|nr:hypothetical protein [Bacteroidales bacterium]